MLISVLLTAIVSLGVGFYLGGKEYSASLAEVKAAAKAAHDELVSLVSKEQSVQHMEIAKAIFALKKFA